MTIQVRFRNRGYVLCVPSTGYDTNGRLPVGWAIESGLPGELATWELPVGPGDGEYITTVKNIKWGNFLSYDHDGPVNIDGVQQGKAFLYKDEPIPKQFKISILTLINDPFKGWGITLDQAITPPGTVQYPPPFRLAANVLAPVI